jgi:hypothetical protein
MHQILHSSILALLSIQFILSFFAHFTTANVEKTIFVAPHPSPVPAENPGLDDLGLERLSPSDSVVRTYLNASFPTQETPQGSESWFYLEDLNPGQRYEVRICWLATVSYILPIFPPLIENAGTGSICLV